MTTVLPPPARERARTRRVIGAALLAVGLALLGYVGWQLVGTTVVAHHRQDAVVEATERVWGVEPGSTVRPEDGELVEGVVALVRVPALGDDYVVPAYAGTGDDVLARGYGVFDGSAEPGGVGNLALTAHRITHGEPLRDLPELESGDEVIVETASRVYTYVLDTPGDALTVDDSATWVTDSLPANPEPSGVAPAAPYSRLLTLVTCSELFHTDGRLVAFGHLVDVAVR